MNGVALPTGVVTFLFTDIEGSTRRWEADPEVMRAALADHDDVLHTAIEARGGRVFKHTGDGGVRGVHLTAHQRISALAARLTDGQSKVGTD